MIDYPTYHVFGNDIESDNNVSRKIRVVEDEKARMKPTVEVELYKGRVDTFTYLDI